MDTKNLTYLLPLLLATASCQDHSGLYDKENDLKNDFTISWIRSIGIVDPQQDWSMAKLVTADVDPTAFGSGATIRIYNSDPAEGARLIGVAAKPTTLYLDVDKELTSLYAVAVNQANEILGAGECKITNGSIKVDAKQMMSRGSRGELVEVAADDYKFDWTIACEDLGTIGDFDFNDLVFGINHVAGDDHITITALAAGGTLEAEVYVETGLSGENAEVRVGEIHDMIEAGSSIKTMLNTSSWQHVGKSYEVTVATNWCLMRDGNLSGIKLVVNGDRPIFPPHKGDAPQMICIKGDWLWPKETTNICTAYPLFKEWNGNASLMGWQAGYKPAEVLVWKTSTPINGPTISQTMMYGSYSQDMIESHGESFKTVSDEKKNWDYVNGLVLRSILEYCDQYSAKASMSTANYYSWAQTYANEALGYETIAEGVVAPYVQFRTDAPKLMSDNMDEIEGNHGVTDNKGKLTTDAKAHKQMTLDNIASTKVLIPLYQKTGTTLYKSGADLVYTYLRNHYHRIPSGEGVGGFWHKCEYENEMWLDGLYMGAAFMAEYLAAFDPADEDAAWDDITLQFTIIDSKTYDEAKHLNYHAWASPLSATCSDWAPGGGHSAEFWGRGMGWYFAALADVLEYMEKAGKKGTTNYNTILGLYKKTAKGVTEHQDAKSHVWYQLLQYDGSLVVGGTANYLEASASCMFTYALLKGLRLGYLDSSYRPNAEMAYKSLFKEFITYDANASAPTGREMNINHVCKSAGLGGSTNRPGDANYYLNGSDVTVVSNDGKAIGPFILASLEYEKSN